MYLNKSFTLIEILVVIVVIGIISSFIIVGLSSISDKANIAKSKVFLDSLDNSLLLSRVSQWKIDDGSGSVTIDSWSNNVGTLGTSTIGDAAEPVWITSNCVSGNCLLFDGINDYVQLGTWDLTINPITVSVWINPKVDPSIMSDKRFFSANYYEARFDSNNLEIRIFDTAFRTLLYSASNFKIDTWYNVIITSNTNDLKLYVNGSLKNQNNTFTLISHPYNLNIGANYVGDNRFFNGLMDDVRIYNQVISAFLIKNNYYLGINKLLISNIIKNQEYIYRTAEIKKDIAKGLAK